jgi:hypothetical protein
VRAELTIADIVFVRVAFGSSVGLDSDREDPSLGTLSSWFVHFLADAGAKLVVDETVELGLALGGGLDRYDIAFNELLPTTEYPLVRPAVLTAIRLLGTQLVLDAELGVRIALGVGELESVYGVRHEQLGFDAALRLRGVVDPGFAWMLEGGVRRTWLSFERTGGTVTGTDGGWHLTALAGWAF